MHVNPLSFVSTHVRLLVFTELIEGAVFVVSCEADGGSAYDVSLKGMQRAWTPSSVTYLWSPGRCSGCVHGSLHSPVICQHEHYLYALRARSGYTVTPLRVHRGGNQPRGTGPQQVEMSDPKSIMSGRPETRRVEAAAHIWIL